MTHYERGAALERQAGLILASRGFTVHRNAGSHSPVDLIAMHAHLRPWGVQCKIDRRRLYPGEWSALWDWGLACNAVPVVCDRSGPRGTPRFYLVTAPRPPRGKLVDYLEPLDLAVAVAR